MYMTTVVKRISFAENGTSSRKWDAPTWICLDIYANCPKYNWTKLPECRIDARLTVSGLRAATLMSVQLLTNIIFWD